VAVEGWAATSELTAVELARRFEDVGVAAIIYTDIDRDGVLKGLNLPGTVALAEATSIPFNASGGPAPIECVKAGLGMALEAKEAVRVVLQNSEPVGHDDLDDPPIARGDHGADGAGHLELRLLFNLRVRAHLARVVGRRAIEEAMLR